MAQDLVGRVKRLLLSPKAEWDAIDLETVEPGGLVTGYVVPLAAIPAVASFVGFGLIGPWSIGSALGYAIVNFIMTIVMVFVFAFIINALAPTFGAEKNYRQALKTSAHAPTATWVAGIFLLIPFLGILTLIGAIYSLYLLFVGLPKMMKPPQEKTMTYTVVSIIAAIVAALVFGFIASRFTQTPAGPFGRSAEYSSRNEASREMERRAEALEKAAESGDMGAVMGAIGSMAGGDPDAPVVDGDALRNLAPDRLAGLQRTSLEVQSMTTPVKATVMTAVYGDGDKRLELNVSNSPMLASMTGWASMGATYNKSSDDGYERLRRDGDSMIIEEWSKSSKRGRYGKTLLGSFIVDAKGRGVEMRDLERAVGEFGERKLKNLPEAE